MRLAHPILATLAIVTLIACGNPRQQHYEYVFRKGQISQAQLLEDERTLRDTTGVFGVHTTRNHDGSATLWIETSPNAHIQAQERLTQMGYVLSEH